MNQDLRPLSPLLAGLVAAERANVVADPVRAASVLAATEGVLALGGVTPGAHAPGAAGAGNAALTSASTVSMSKAIALAFLTFVAGAGVGVALDRRVTPHRGSPVVATGATTAALVAPVTPSAEPPALPVQGLPNATGTAARSPAPPGAALSDRGGLAQEQALIDAARAGLASGRNDAAVAATERHARTFPRGQLAEERDAMRVIALARLGRGDEARQRADAFRVTYPASGLLPKVDAALR